MMISPTPGGPGSGTSTSSATSAAGPKRENWTAFIGGNPIWVFAALLRAAATADFAKIARLINDEK
jgi:hypothetical protein